MPWPLDRFFRQGCQAKKGHDLLRFENGPHPNPCVTSISLFQLELCLTGRGRAVFSSGFRVAGLVAGGNLSTLLRVTDSKQMVSERINLEAIFGSLLPHSRTPSSSLFLQQRLKSQRLPVLFGQGGQALPVSGYIKMKPLGQGCLCTVPLFPTPNTLLSPHEVLINPGSSAG